MIKIENIVTKSCKHCGKEFSYNKLGRQSPPFKYCSVSCRLARNRYVNKRPAKLEVGVCWECGKTFNKIHSRHRFCSLKCATRIKNQKKTARRKYRGNSGFVLLNPKCEVCGFSMVEALEAHHYSLTDRVVLCGNCHNIWHKTSKEKYASKEVVVYTITRKLFEHQMGQGKQVPNTPILHRIGTRNDER